MKPPTFQTHVFSPDGEKEKTNRTNKQEKEKIIFFLGKRCVTRSCSNGDWETKHTDASPRVKKKENVMDLDEPRDDVHHFQGHH